MGSEHLGRTNRAYPPVWLQLCVPGDSAQIAPLLDAAIQADTVLDVSTQPGLWGGRLRHHDCLLLASGGLDLECAPDEKLAADLTQAALLQTLSAVGHERIEFYCLRIRRALEEAQIAGALAALESARQEGHVGHIGLAPEGPPSATLALWQFHDAFEVIILGDEHAAVLEPLAAERRVGVIRRGRRPDGVSLISVDRATQVRQAICLEAV